MAITTYAQLVTAIQTNWLNRASDSQLTTVVDDLITLGEKRIYRKLRIKAMESSATGTVSSGVIALPSDYISLKFAYINTAPVQWLDRKTSLWIYQNYPLRTATGATAKFVSREGSNFIFGPVPADGQVMNYTYYARPVALSSSLNSIFTSNPDLFLFAALCEAEPWLSNDERIPVWEKKFAEILKDVQDESDDEEQSGSGLRVVSI